MRSSLLKFAILSLTSFFMNVSCRTETENLSQLERIPLRAGTLFVDPAGDVLITGGIVQYRIYATGELFYSGDISYFGSDSLSELQIPFQGRYRVTAADVSSATYREQGKSREIKKVTFNSEEVDPQTNRTRLFAFVSDYEKVDSKDAQGDIIIDTKEPIIKIVSADLTGTLFENTAFETSIRLRLSENEFQ